MTTITSGPLFMSDYGQVTRYTMENANGMQVTVINLGATITEIRVPDRDGTFADVALSYDDYEGFRSRKYFLGATIGRCGNRIGKGRFSLNGKSYQLALNDNGKNHLHGGISGFDQKLWAAAEIDCDAGKALEFRLTSLDGDENYPGKLEVKLTCTLTANNELVLQYHAVSDADTICNLTNHSYFNLAGHDSGTMLDQKLRIHASRFTEADAESIPTGQVLPVEGTPMDFREFHAVGERIGEDYTPLVYGGGYDHNWVLDAGCGELEPCAELYDERSGRYLVCKTDCPCVQFYSGNFIDGTQRGKGGCYYGKRAGLCLETQFAPDAINHPEWDSPVLKAGEPYSFSTIYQFGVK